MDHMHGCAKFHIEVIDMSKMNLPLDLYKANLELQARLGKLFQEGGKQWLDYGYRLVNDGIAETDAEIEQVLRSEDWQKLATLPAESFWRQLQQRFGDSQAATQMAVTAQAGFVRGLQEAVQAWQKQTTEALGTVASTTAFGDPTWSNLFKPWEQLLPTGSTGRTASGKPATKGSR